jgi:hypothetical protein
MRERRRTSIPSLVGIRASFVKKMTVSGSRMKDEFSRRDIRVPPCDAEDPEKNWDSVSTLGNQCAEQLGSSGRLEPANQFLDELMSQDDEANAPSPNTGKRPKRSSATTSTLRRISEGMEEEDKMEAMRMDIIDLRAKSEKREEKMVTMEVKLDDAIESLGMALESLREAKENMAADKAAADRIKTRASEETSPSARVLYSLKSRIKELEMENMRLRKQLPSKSREIAPENAVADQPKEAAKPSNRRRRISFTF